MKKKKDDLTSRQLDVIKLASRGKSNKVIGKLLYITDSTVKAHLTAIYKKFGVTNRTEAAIVAIDRGLIPRQDSEQP